MPQDHLATVFTAFFAEEIVIPQANPLMVFALVFVFAAAVALALWAARPMRGLGQKLLTPRPDDPEGLPWMPGGEIFPGSEQPVEPAPVPAPARAFPPTPDYQPTYQPAPEYQQPIHQPAPTYPQPTYEPSYQQPTYQPSPTYQPEPAYRPASGAPQFGAPQPAPPQPPSAPARNPWSTS